MCDGYSAYSCAEWQKEEMINLRAVAGESIKTDLLYTANYSGYIIGYKIIWTL